MVGPPGQPTAAKRVALFLADTTRARRPTMTPQVQMILEIVIVVLRIVSAGLTR
jgi:hypothetical protein